MAKKPKPCELPCPRCGHEGINRQYIAAGEETVKPNCRKAEYEQRSGDRVVEQYDRIRHHCRCCRYEWDTKTACDAETARICGETP